MKVKKEKSCWNYYENNFDLRDPWRFSNYSLRTAVWHLAWSLQKVNDIEKKQWRKKKMKKEMGGGEGNIYFPSLVSFFNTKLFQWFLRLTYLTYLRSFKILRSEIFSCLWKAYVCFILFHYFLFSIFCLVPTVCQALH